MPRNGKQGSLRMPACIPPTKGLDWGDCLALVLSQGKAAKTHSRVGLLKSSRQVGRVLVLGSQEGPGGVLSSACNTRRPGAPSWPSPRRRPLVWTRSPEHPQLE